MLIADLRIFLSVVSTGSLSAAARQLDVVPMQVSRRIAALEDELGVRLFHRTTRSVSLTSEGEALAPYAHTMIDAEESVLGELRPMPDAVKGVLRMTAPSVFGQSIVLSVLPQLMEQHPELYVELEVSDKVVDIVASGLDLALRVAPLADSELIARRIAPNPRVLCAAPAYLEQHGFPRNLADLDRHKCILLQAVSQWPFVIHGEVQRRRMQGRLITSSVDAVRTAATQGLGIAMLTYWDVVQHLRDGLLREIKLEDAEMEALSVWAVTPTRRHVPARVKVFLDTLDAFMKRLN
ncbi:LysR family transcriptional regulator [Pseudomonas sp. 18175]|uniref:LysR family transcriptional regulator n=1 Tax=Pseudomonas sp. 18175 TaxID=3390056 RepID=UPI003D1B8BDE